MKSGFIVSVITLLFAGVGCQVICEDDEFACADGKQVKRINHEFFLNKIYN
jgi:hypothetical protein